MQESRNRSFICFSPQAVEWRSGASQEYRTRRNGSMGSHPPLGNMGSHLRVYTPTEYEAVFSSGFWYETMCSQLRAIHDFLFLCLRDTELSTCKQRVGVSEAVETPGAPFFTFRREAGNTAVLPCHSWFNIVIKGVICYFCYDQLYGQAMALIFFLIRVLLC